MKFLYYTRHFRGNHVTMRKCCKKAEWPEKNIRVFLSFCMPKDHMDTIIMSTAKWTGLAKNPDSWILLPEIFHPVSLR